MWLFCAYSFEEIPLEMSQILWRAHQVFHTVAEHESRYILPSILIFGNLLAISACFTFIRYYNTQSIFLIFIILAVGILAVVLIGIASFVGYKVTSASLALREHLGAKVRLNLGLKIQKQDMAFVKSCMDLKWSFNGWFRVERDFFMVILHSIILDNVITLLMTF